MEGVFLLVLSSPCPLSVFSSVRAWLRVPDILSGYTEGQIFSLMEGKRTCETRGLERERSGKSEGRQEEMEDG